MQMDMIILVGSIAIAMGGLVSAGYYFARYAIRTDHEEDRDLASKHEAALPAADQEPAEFSAKVPQKLQQITGSEQVLGQPDEKAALLSQLQTSPATLQSAMAKTRESLWGRLKGVFSSGPAQEHMDAIEEILYTSDLGPRAVVRLMESVQENSQNLQSFEALKSAFRSEFTNILQPVGNPPTPFSGMGSGDKPQVWMIVGVNGVGKTTTIGKLAHMSAQQGLKVLVAAGDTFRAAAQNQLRTWSDRAQVEIFSPEGVTDPAAVAFDAVQMAGKRGFDLVLIDTAGRLHTQKNLMEELKKVKRVMQKQKPEIPQEILIILDANSGQNALVQAREFHEALGLTGAVVTKMDGTAKGGVVLGLAEELKLPTRMIGVGEGMSDLKNFSADEYVSSILG